MNTSTQTISSKPLPSWTTFMIKEFEKGVRECKSVLMGDHLIILAHDGTYNLEGPEGDIASEEGYSEPENPEPAVLFAIDLRDNSVQQVVMEELFWHEEYSFTKYKENQIIKYGGMDSFQDGIDKLYQITIESFKPLKVKCKEIADGEGPGESRHVAEIYEDALYTFYNDVWRFDLIKHTWKELKTSGKPPESMEPSSFLIEDNMYVYGGKKNGIFVLNLKTLVWTKIKQQAGVAKQMNLDRGNIYGDLYKGNLLIINSDLGSDSESDGPETDEICCWNIENNSWSTYKIQKNFIDKKMGNLVVYKNLLLTTVTTGNKFYMRIFDLNNLDLPISESVEQKQIKSLFLSEQDSDIKFKVQDKIIPAHKQVLIDKSKYFAGLFNSGMAESRQEVIEINDCEYSVFQEFLRFLYCDKIEVNPALAFKLFLFADQYVQDDLSERIMNYLTHNISSENVYAIFDFAFQHDLSLLVTWCFLFLRNNINIDNVSELIKYVDSQDNSEHAKEILELRKYAVAAIILGYEVISEEQKEKIPFYMDFLIKSVEMSTVRRFIIFIWDGPNARSFSKKDTSRENDDVSASFEKDTVNLRKRICSFVDENFTHLKMNDILDDISSHFWLDFVSSIRENPDQRGQKTDDKAKEEGKANDESVSRDRKRMEPVKTEEAKPELKKTKKI